MKKSKAILSRTSNELAQLLGLSALDGAEIEVRSDLNEEIITIFRRSGLTHARLAKLAATSRTRITAILNRNTHNVSTDLLLRVLRALGYRVTLRVSRIKAAA